jgi:catenin beta 1
LSDNDLVVVHESVKAIYMLSEKACNILNDKWVVDCIIQCLYDTRDLETARALIGTLYRISTIKPDGVTTLIDASAIKMLLSGVEPIVLFAIPAIQNTLLECRDKVKKAMTKMGAVENMIPSLIQTQNVKFLSIVTDCLQLLAFGNAEAKAIILELGGTQHLVTLLNNKNQYKKLILNTTRLLKVDFKEFLVDL